MCMGWSILHAIVLHYNGNPSPLIKDIRLLIGVSDLKHVVER